MNLSAIMQPTFLPWIGYFDLIDQVDNFVFYDDVQLARRSWQIRNRIKSSNGELYLTIPIKKSKSRDDLLICESEISYEEKWQNKHLKSIESSYRKAAHFTAVFEFLVAQYESKHHLLSQFNESFIKNVAENLGIKTTFLTSSSLEGIEGAKDARLAAICKKINSTMYLSPQGSADYIEALSAGGELYRQNIELYYHFYEHPKYTQLYPDFIPYMSILDLLFNEGFENALDIIRTGRKDKVYFLEFRKDFLKL